MIAPNAMLALVTIPVRMLRIFSAPRIKFDVSVGDPEKDGNERDRIGEAVGQHDPPLGPFGHLGVACANREEIDRLHEQACLEGRTTRAPFDAGEPIGYVARIADPDGNSLELSFGQEVGLAVAAAAKETMAGQSGS